MLEFFRCYIYSVEPISSIVIAEPVEKIYYYS